MHFIVVALLFFTLFILSYRYLKAFANGPTGPLRRVSEKLPSHPAWQLRSIPTNLLPKASKAALVSIAGTGQGLLPRLYEKIFHAKELAEKEDDEKYQAGEPYGDPDVIATGLVKDLTALGIKGRSGDLRTLIQLVKNTGKPVNDREMLVSFHSPPSYPSTVIKAHD